MANAIDAPLPLPADQPAQSAADKLLGEVHQELELQSRATKREGPVGHFLDFVYDPLVKDQKNLLGTARVLDAENARGEYDLMAQQADVINKELALDQRRLSLKSTIDFVADDVVTAAPELAVAGAAAGAKLLRHAIDGAPAQVPPVAADTVQTITKAGDYREEITVDGKVRTYKIHVPPSYDPEKPMPAVVMLHGITEDADTFAQNTQMNAKADRDGFITVFPEGNPILRNRTHLAWNVPNWDVFHPARHADDLKFVEDVIKQLPSQVSVDPKRLFVAGFSNGGMLAQEVAAQDSDKVAAVALVGTALSGKDSEPAKPVSVIDIHGTADPVVPYQNWDNNLDLVKMEPVSYTGQFWQKADHIKVPGTKNIDGDLIEQDSINPATGVEVKQIGIIGGVHEWPGPAAQEPSDRNFDATNEIWNFFARHPFDGSVAADQRIEA